MQGGKYSMKEIESLVLQYQEGDIAIFDRIYEELEKDKHTIIAWLRRNSPVSVTDADIHAIYDDALLASVDTYKAGDATFISYFRTVCNNKRAELARFVGRKKRASETPDVNLEHEITEGLTVVDSTEDLSASELMLQAEGSEILFLLQEYGKQSSKKSLNATLIAHETLHFISSKEKYNSIRNITGLTASDTALRLKCKRAKEDFRKFVEENKIK